MEARGPVGAGKSSLDKITIIYFGRRSLERNGDKYAPAVSRSNEAPRNTTLMALTVGALR
jgi:hypothetical protein